MTDATLERCPIFGKDVDPKRGVNPLEEMSSIAGKTLSWFQFKFCADIRKLYSACYALLGFGKLKATVSL